MSKIYEALLRAELERAVATGQPANESSVAVHDVLLPSDESATADELESFPSSLSDPLHGSAYVGSYVSSPDLSQVGLRAWDPVFSSLPALCLPIRCWAD